MVLAGAPVCLLGVCCKLSVNPSCVRMLTDVVPLVYLWSVGIRMLTVELAGLNLGSPYTSF
jgi:hypothetical protein